MLAKDENFERAVVGWRCGIGEARRGGGQDQEGEHTLDSISQDNFFFLYLFVIIFVVSGQ